MPGRFVLWVVAILALTGLYTCWCETPLIWDGAYQLAIMLREQQPYSFEGRFHSYILWLPVVPLSRWTENVHVLQFVYGLPFAMAPALGLGMSWWIVRKENPHLIIWPVFGIAAATLPGQIFIINDSIFQQHVFWPVFMSVFVRLTRAHLAVLLFLVAFQFSHAIGFPLLTGAAGAAALLAMLDRENRRRLLWRVAVFALLAGLAVAKIRLVPDSYAATEATWDKAVERWQKGVAGWPVRGLCMMWLSAAMVLAHAWLARRGWGKGATVARGLALLSALVGAGMWVYWASDEHRWALVIDFRRWVVPLTLPFFFSAVLEACTDAWARRRSMVQALADKPVAHKLPAAHMLPAAHRGAEPVGEVSPAVWCLRRPLALVLGFAFAIVLCIQSVQWRVMSSRLMEQVRAYPSPLVPHDAFPWSDGTALQHWATVTYVMVMQGKTPEKLIVNEEGYRAVFDPARPRIPYSWFHLLPAEPGPAGWYDHRPLMREVHREREAAGR